MKKLFGASAIATVCAASTALAWTFEVPSTQPIKPIEGPNTRYAAVQPIKGIEGPDIRKQEPKGIEGPDIRSKPTSMTAAATRGKVEPKGIEGPDIRKVEPKGIEGPDIRQKSQ